MDRIILDRIPFEIDGKDLAKLLRIKPGSRNEAELQKMLGEAHRLARPKAAFAVTEPHLTGGEAVVIEGVTFTSRVLHNNLRSSGIVFPYGATCGPELEAWAQAMSGTLHSFWADTIMLLALGSAMGFLETYLRDRLGQHVPLSSMNPGSLEDWPLQEQAPLFTLLGDCMQEIGMSLTDRMLLRPLKSVTGIQFISADGFVNCSLCPRKSCPSRRAAFDHELSLRTFS